jgi:phosphoesterase RecJ-like protein
MSSLKEVAAALKGCKTVLVSSHISPDADSIGSAFGAASLLLRSGIRADIYLIDEVPPRFLKLTFTETTKNPRVIHTVPTEQYDAVLVVDTASRTRIGKHCEEVYARGACIINLDHHVSNPNWGDVNFVDGSAAAAAVLVTELADELGLKINQYEANLLYGGLSDDTGGFGFSNVNSRALITAAKLVEAGAQPAEITNALHYSMPEKALRFQGFIISKTQVLLGGNVAYVSITAGDMEKHGVTVDDVEGIVDTVRKIGGPKVVVLQRQIEDGWKFSLRSKVQHLDMNTIAGSFGGGGHKMAAGCKLEGSEDDARDRVLAAVLTSLSTSS